MPKEARVTRNKNANNNILPRATRTSNNNNSTPAGNLSNPPLRTRLGNTAIVHREHINSSLVNNTALNTQPLSSSVVVSTPVIPWQNAIWNFGNTPGSQFTLTSQQIEPQHQQQQPVRTLRDITNQQQQQRSIIFSKPTNIYNDFQNSINGQMIAENLMDPNFHVDKGITDEAINYALNLLYQENNKSLSFGKRKKSILKNVAKSLIITFPRLKTPIRPGENPDWEFKTLYFIDPISNKESGHILHRYKRLQRVIKRENGQEN